MNTAVTSRRYKGNFPDDAPISDGGNNVVELCGAWDGSTLWNTGKFDLINFVWIQGAQVLYQDSSGNSRIFSLNNVFQDATCLWKAFLNPYQESCLMCRSGYYLKDNRKCVASNSDNNYFLHTPTSSYQSK